MILLDLFCGAGGASMGYHQAGFQVVGVDIEPMPNYPFQFIQADAMIALKDDKFIAQFDAIHASPPCQGYSTLSYMYNESSKYPKLVPEVRDELKRHGKPWVIENVIGAPLIRPAQLCGTWFGLPIQRHRLFESNVKIDSVPCVHGAYEPRFVRIDHGKKYLSGLAPAYGHNGSIEDRQIALGIDWMTQDEMAEAIPPAYAEYVGQFLFAEVIARQ